MDNFILTILSSVISGAAGYVIARFWLQPVFQYREIKMQIISDLVFYANAINPNGLNEEMKQRVLDRMIANRRHSANLTACYYSLPRKCRDYLIKKGEYPDKASSEFIYLSNTTEYDEAIKAIKRIQVLLRIDPPIV